MNTRKTILVLFAVLLVGGLAVWWYSGFTLDFMRFFATDTGTATTVKLYPVFDQATSKVRFVLETGTYEITSFQFRAGISAATFTNISGFTGSMVFSQIVDAADLLSDGSLSFAAGIASAEQPGATTTTTIATIDYTTLSADTAATQICVTVDMANTLVTARDIDPNVLDMGLNGWSNEACIPIATPTVISPSPSASPGGGMVQCSPATQTVNVGAQTTVTATSGSGTYSWFAPESNLPSRVSETATFSVSYRTPGIKKVTVQSPRGDGSSNIDSVACTVIVTP